MPYYTDSELIEQFEFGSILLANQLHNNSNFLEESEHYPFMIVVSPADNLKILHTNKKHTELTGYSLEEVRNDFYKYLTDIVHPATLRNVRNFLPDFYRNQSMQQTLSFIQYVKLYGKKNYCPIISFTKAPASGQNLTLRTILLPNQVDKMAKNFQQIVKMDRFRLKNFRKFQLLSNRESQVLKLMAEGNNNPQIAEKLFISRFTVETHRKSIRNKLEIQSNKEVLQYALAFELLKI